MTQQPDLQHLPVLSRHAHLDPSDGACLMEYVAVIAGEPFSDAPACTHPVLAAIARLVNDATSDTGRPRLAVLAPDLAATGAGGREPAVDAELVAAVVHAAAGHTGHPRLVRLARHAYHRQRHLDRRRPSSSPVTRAWRRLEAGVWRRGPAMHVLASAVAVASKMPRRDTALRAMLTAALDTWYASQRSARRASRATV